MEPWNTNGDHLSVTTREAAHRSDETPQQYELPVGTVEREDTTPPTAQTHRQTGCPRPRQDPAPQWVPHSRPPSPPPRTQKRGRQGTMAARPAAPTRGPTQRCHTRPTTSTPINCQYPLLMLRHPNSPRKKENICDTTIPGHRWSQSDIQNRLHAHHLLSIGSTTSPEHSCRPLRSTFHRIYKTRHTTLTGKSLFAATGKFNSGETHPQIARNG